MNGRGQPKVTGYIKGFLGHTGLYNCHHDMYCKENRGTHNRSLYER